VNGAPGDHPKPAAKLLVDKPPAIKLIQGFVSVRSCYLSGAIYAGPLTKNIGMKLQPINNLESHNVRAKKPSERLFGGSERPGFDRVRRICRVTAKGHR
jgi:hypothetical protein